MAVDSTVYLCVRVSVGVCILQQSGNGLVLHSAARGLPVASCPVSIIVGSVGHYTCCQVTLSLSLSLYVSVTSLTARRIFLQKKSSL